MSYAQTSPEGAHWHGRCRRVKGKARTSPRGAAPREGILTSGWGHVRRHSCPRHAVSGHTVSGLSGDARCRSCSSGAKNTATVETRAGSLTGPHGSSLHLCMWAVHLGFCAFRVSADRWRRQQTCRRLQQLQCNYPTRASFGIRPPAVASGT